MPQFLASDLFIFKILYGIHLTTSPFDFWHSIPTQTNHPNLLSKLVYLSRQGRHAIKIVLSTQCSSTSSPSLIALSYQVLKILKRSKRNGL